MAGRLGKARGMDMRRLRVFNHVSLDGFFAGPSGEIDWHFVDREVNEYAEEMLSQTDTLLFGRVTYQLMATYWPTPEAMTNDPIVAGRMTSAAKVVFSRTLEKVEWQNSRLAKGSIEAEITQLKQQPGRDLAILGSSSIVSACAQLGVVDEFEFMVNPVVLGTGRSMFDGLRDRIHLKFIKTRVFQSGNILLSYEPVRE